VPIGKRLSRKRIEAVRDVNAKLDERRATIYAALKGGDG
jgi:hypothetical protein